MVDRLNEALTVLKKKPNNGERLYRIIYYTYIYPEQVSHKELLLRLDLSTRHYYRLRKVERTEATVSKMDITGSAEVPGCDLEIKDKEGNVIIKWTSGVQGTIVLSDKLGSLGYRNVAAYLDEKGNLQVSGLFHDVTYTLTETRPADGYVTSDDIQFQLIEGENGQTLVAIFEGEDMKLKEDHIVLMYDDTTKIRLLKIASDTGEGLAKAKFEVYDSDKNKVFEFETSDEGYDVMAPESDNCIIYGHNINAHKMFGALHAYSDKTDLLFKDMDKVYKVKIKHRERASFSLIILKGNIYSIRICYMALFLSGHLH